MFDEWSMKGVVDLAKECAMLDRDLVEEVSVSGKRVFVEKHDAKKVSSSGWQVVVNIDGREVKVAILDLCA